MDKYSGEDLLLGLYAIQKKAAEAPWALKEHELPKGNWKRVTRRQLSHSTSL